MSPAEDSVSGQPNLYAVDQAVAAPESSDLLQVATAVAITIFTELLSTGAGFAVSWIRSELDSGFAPETADGSTTDELTSLTSQKSNPPNSKAVTVPL